MDFLIILLFGFALMWLLIVMPQRRRQRAHQEMVTKLSPGDYVLTAGGLYGTVVDIGEDDLGLEIAPELEVRVAKGSVSSVVPPDEIEDIEVSDEEPEAAIEENRG